MKNKKITQFISYSLFALIVIPVATTVYFSEDIKNKEIIAVNTSLPSAKAPPTQREEPPIEESSVAALGEEPSSQAVKEVVAGINLGTLENYIVCVVAAEMPALFNDEALKAQAVAARTYAINQMDANNFTMDEMIGLGGQAYIDTQGMKTRWGNNYDTYHNKIKAAVDATGGEIMVYNGEPILAVFHAISRGKTEASENVWNSAIPYLKSVDSACDAEASEYAFETSLSYGQIVKLMKDKYNDFLVDGDLASSIEIVSHSDAGYISTVKIGNKTLTGKQFREALGLRSTDFTYEKKGDNIAFTTNGYGHGAGMSQYGAHFLAEDGKNYKEILAHYYTGISFTNIK